MSNRSELPVYVGVMGYSKATYDLALAESELRTAFGQLREAYPGRQIIIVSGHTDMGVPGQAYRLARDVFRFGTVGLTARRAHATEPDGSPKYPLFPVDTVIAVGTENDPWGVESPAFIQFCTRFVCLGEGPQSLHEAKMARDAGKDVQHIRLPMLVS